MERGAIAFHKAVKDTLSGWMPYQSINNPAVIKKVDSPLHDNALSAGYQFVEWQAPNGVKVKVEVDSFYDDPVNKNLAA